jgi:hypothetical protein
VWGRPFVVTRSADQDQPIGATGQRLSVAVICGRFAAVVDVTVMSPRAATV